MTPSCHLCTTYLRRTFVFLLRGFPCSLEPEKSILIHDVTLLVHPRRHVDRVHFSVYDTSLPPPFLPAGESARVNVAIGCFILYPFFCFSVRIRPRCDAPTTSHDPLPPPTPTFDAIRDRESCALSGLFIISKISNLQRLRLLGIILTSGIRYRLCSSKLVPSATRTYKARSSLAYD
jgi:hypothetical protein